MTHLDPLAGSGPARPEREVRERVGAVVLAGGTSSRLGGADKASIELDGVTLLERALAATMTAMEVVVVGEQVPTTRPVTWTLEDPRSGGPAAGLLAGLQSFLRQPAVVQVLAVDMPRVGPGTFARLSDALENDPGADGALLVDADGRRQPLCGLYRRGSLMRAAPAPEDRHGLPLHRLLQSLRLLEVPPYGGEERDIDTWADLRRERRPREV